MKTFTIKQNETGKPKSVIVDLNDKAVGLHWLTYDDKFYIECVSDEAVVMLTLKPLWEHMLVTEKMTLPEVVAFLKKDGWEEGDD